MVLIELDELAYYLGFDKKLFFRRTVSVKYKGHKSFCKKAAHSNRPKTTVLGGSAH